MIGNISSKKSRFRNLRMSPQGRRLLFILVTVGIAAGSPLASAEGKPLHQTLSGWGVPNAGLDVDGNLTGIHGHFYGTGTLGRTQSNGALDLVFIGTPCDQADGTSGLLLEYVAYTLITFTRNGDQLHRTLLGNGANSACFDPVSGRSSVEVDLKIVGGTGRFRNATGRTRIESKVTPLGKQNSIQAIESGRIRRGR